MNQLDPSKHSHPRPTNKLNYKILKRPMATPSTTANLNPQIRTRRHLTNHKIGNPNPSIRSPSWCPRIWSHLSADVHNPISHGLESEPSGESRGEVRKEKEKKREKRKNMLVEWELSVWGIKKYFLLIPFSYNELLEIVAYCSNHSKFFSFTFFAIVCVFGVLVAKMNK